MVLGVKEALEICGMRRKEVIVNTEFPQFLFVFREIKYFKQIFPPAFLSFKVRIDHLQGFY